MKSSEEGELDDEADWIYRHAFLETPISQQQVGISHGLMLLWFKMNAAYIKVIIQEPMFPLAYLVSSLRVVYMVNHPYMGVQRCGISL